MSHNRLGLSAELLEDRSIPAAGGLDPTFGSGGVSNFAGSGITEVQDGRFFASLGDINGSDLSRYLADGTLDSSFATLHLPLTPGNLSAGVYAAMSDGGAIVGRTIGTPDVDVQFVLERYTPAGTLDTTFGTAGSLVLGPTSKVSAPVAITLTPNGQIVFVGNQSQAASMNGLFPTARSIFVARLSATGQLDNAFGTGGVTLVSFPTPRTVDTIASAVSVEYDGQIDLGGANAVSIAGSQRFDGSPFVMRLNANGELDTTFGTTGAVTQPRSPITPTTDQARYPIAAIQADTSGRIVAAWRRFGSGSIIDAVRYLPSGAVDTSYGNSGFVVFPDSVGDPSHNAPEPIAAIDSLGRVVVANNYLHIPGTFLIHAEAYRITSGGKFDPEFGTNGRVDLGTEVGQDGYYSGGIAIQGNGDIILGGDKLLRLIGDGPPSGFVQTTAGAVVASGAANGQFQVLNPTAGNFSIAGTVTNAPATKGTVRVATGDVNDDGVPDILTGAGPGGPPRIIVVDGKTGDTLSEFLAFEPGFTGGVFVTAADLDGDGKAEVVVTPDRGGGPRVIVFSIAPEGAAAIRASFFGIDDPAFRGGARAALGDVNNDGTPDLAVAAGFLGGPRVALFDGTSIFGSQSRLVGDFFAFPGNDALSLRNGAFVAVGDITGDGFGELIFGGGPGGAPRVFILNGQTVSGGDVAAAQAAPVANFFVNGNTTNRAGIRVASANADCDSKADLILGSGEGDPAKVRIYLGANFASTDEPSTFQDVNAFGGPTLVDGVFVG